MDPLTLVLLALAACVYPTLLAGVILILAHPRPLRMLLGFLAGGLTISMIAGHRDRPRDRVLRRGRQVESHDQAGRVDRARIAVAARRVGDRERRDQPRPAQAPASEAGAVRPAQALDGKPCAVARIDHDGVRRRTRAQPPRGLVPGSSHRDRQGDAIDRLGAAPTPGVQRDHVRVGRDPDRRLRGQPAGRRRPRGARLEVGAPPLEGGRDRAGHRGGGVADRQGDHRAVSSYVQLPQGWERVSADGAGPVRHGRGLSRTRRPRGALAVAIAPQGLAGLAISAAIPGRPEKQSVWWRPRTRLKWWMAVLFCIGSACFTRGCGRVAVGELRTRLGIGVVFFVGSLFFTSAALPPVLGGGQRRAPDQRSTRTAHDGDRHRGSRAGSTGWRRSYS